MKASNRLKQSVDFDWSPEELTGQANLRGLALRASLR